ncbi:MAG: MCE family protein [Bacteroidetes bacterium]|nr:MCE family protein [Bacteroidota bacterium]
MKISNESKVGALTAVAITILVLGYNYMSGKDDVFAKGRVFYAVYDNVRGLNEGAAVTYNGVRIGQVKKVALNGNDHKIISRVEIYSDLNIPSDSRLKIVVEILGDKRMELLLGESSKFAQDGDTLKGMLETDMTEKVNQKLGPIAEQADSVLQRFNEILSRPSLVRFEDQLPGTLASLQKTIEEVNGLIQQSKPGVEGSISNVKQLTENLKSYNQSISSSLKSFERIGKEADSVDVSAMMNQLQETINNLSTVINRINSGEGSLGQLATNESLYNNLVKTSAELTCLMTDIRSYPDKYLPLPWGKRKRAKASAASGKVPCAPQP